MSTNNHAVRLTGWKTGLRTIELTLLIRAAAQVDLRVAKRMVEQLLNGDELTIHFDTDEQAKQFLAASEGTGAIGLSIAGGA